MVNFRELAYFLHVAEAGGFLKASSRLAIGQPTLSRHVRHLEEAFGVRLFDRNGRGVQLTEAGHSLLHHAKAIVDHMDQACVEMAEMAESPKGSVVLGIPPTVGKVLSLPVASRFLRELPQSHLRIVESFTGHIREWLTLGRIDVGILYDTTGVETGAGEALWNDELFLIGHATSCLRDRAEISLSSIENLPLIIPSHPHGLRLVIDDFTRRHQISLTIALEIDGLNAILDLVADGKGFTILPMAAIADFQKRSHVAAARLVNPAMNGTIIMVTAKERQRTRCISHLLDIIRSEAARLTKQAVPTQ